MINDFIETVGLPTFIVLAVLGLWALWEFVTNTIYFIAAWGKDQKNDNNSIY